MVGAGLSSAGQTDSGHQKEISPLAQLYTEDIAAEFARLTAKGVAFKGEPKTMGPTKFADFDDTCGNFIRLVEG